MHGKSVVVMIAVLVATVALGAAAVSAFAQAAATTRVYELRPPGAPELTITDVELATGDILVYARWGCIFAGLAMVGVIWVGWSLRTIARNQVELGQLIRELAARTGKK